VEHDVRVQAAMSTLGLFGREEALRALSDVLDGGGSAVVTGEPGAGKSSLLKVTQQWASRRGRRVLSVTPTQFERGLPFAGLAELISQCPEGVDASLPAPQWRALAAALHRIEPGEGEVDALAVSLAVRGVLATVCADEPVVLLIDDLQWLDQATVGSLGFAVRGRGVETLVVIAASRPEPGAGQELTRTMAEPKHEITLKPLEDWAIGQLLRDRLGTRWTPPMSEGVARVSGGNPLLALEIGRALQADVPTSSGGVFPVPRSLTELLNERVGRLPQEARQVLLLVSANGRLSVPQLQRLVDETLLSLALEAATDAEIAIVDAESVVSFTHPMLASAIYEAVKPTERRQAHHLLADSLVDSVERAWHRSKSSTMPDESVAAELETAAEISRSRGALQLAAELLEGAALATPSGSDNAAKLSRWLTAVDSYRAAGDATAATAALDKCVTLALSPEHQAELLMRRGRLAPDIRSAAALAQQAFDLAPRGSQVRAELLRTLGTFQRVLGDGPRAMELTKQAISESVRLGRFDVKLSGLNERISIERIWGLGGSADTAREIWSVMESAPTEVLPESMAWARGFFASWNDETAEGYVRRAIADTTSAGRYGKLAGLYISLVLCLIRASRIGDAQIAVHDADRSGAWAPADNVWAATAAPQEDMARILATEYSGDLDEARDLTYRAIARPQIQGAPYWRAGFLAQLGFIEVSARNWPAALEALREVAALFERTGMVDLEQLLWGVDYVDAALQLGEMDDAEAGIAFLRRQGEAGRPEASIAADRCGALLTAAMGNLDGAIDSLRNIVDAPNRECPFEAARSHLALGKVYRRTGQKAMANQVLLHAAYAFDALGVPRWAERAQEEARRIGLRHSEGTLTATERRVAELVGAGRSNHETAAELFMSVKTVEANLTRIYRKLSLRSRTELAVRLGSLNALDGASD
jgi:DNA-binding CsgD family transcriptional regulator